MALLTSYVYRGLEINDGTTYATPNAGLNLDDSQPSEESFLYVRGSTPESLGVTLKEGTVALGIHIIPAGASFDAALNALRARFDTTDPNYYPLSRKLPYESGYKTINVRAANFLVNRQERKVSITLNILDRTWRDGVWQQHQVTLFVDADRSPSFAIPYTGLQPTEPLIEVKALTAGTDGPVPLYFSEATVYASGPEHVIGTPLQLVTGWNTSTLVSQGKMRSDGLDITVELPDGTRIDRYATALAASRTVWCRPHTWPSHGAQVQVSHDPSGTTAGATSIPVTTKTGTLSQIPQSGKVCIGNEIISYTGVQLTTEDGRNGLLTGCTRGVDGTTAADLSEAYYVWVKFPQVLRICYGYAAGYAGTYYGNDLSTWPVLDYTQSDNTTWKQVTANTSPTTAGAYFTGRPLSWRSYLWLPLGPGQHSEGVVTQGTLIGGSGKMALTGYNTLGSGPSWRERLVVQLLPSNSRKVSNVRVLYDLTAGDTGQFRGITATIGKTRNNFTNTFYPDGKGGYSTPENYFSLYDDQHGSGTGAKDSGWLAVGQDSGYGATHIWAHITFAPQTTDPNGVKFQLKEVHYQLDQALAEYPVVKFDTTVKGAGVGQFPVVMSIINWSDPAENEWFTMFPRLAVNGVATYDCEANTVTGARLQDCTYDHPKWLRLMPGSNSIQVNGTQGIGQVQLTIKWQTRN